MFSFRVFIFLFSLITVTLVSIEMRIFTLFFQFNTKLMNECDDCVCGNNNNKYYTHRFVH